MKADGGWTYRRMGVHFAIEDAAGTRVAEVRYVVRPDGSTTEDVAQKAAAAPELYEALDEAPVLSRYHGKGFDLEGFVRDYENWSAKKRAALAKARGESATGGME